MSEGAYLDADIVLKLCAYHAHEELLRASTIEDQVPAILAVSAFSLTSRVKRSRTILNRTTVEEILRDALKAMRRLEPDGDEVVIAAELEQRAIDEGLELDIGESQLFAILLRRSARLLITGDKRAVRALSILARGQADHRIACLEQLVASVVLSSDVGQLRARVCAESAVDRAVTASFACSSQSVTAEQVMQGLCSYTSDLRKDTGRTLIPSDDLSAVVP